MFGKLLGVDLKQLIPQSMQPWLLPAAGAVVVLIVIKVIWGFLARQARRRRPANIHPKLQKYNVDRRALLEQQADEAAAIVASSTSARLAGYRITQQVEAVFVEEQRNPEEAMIALKAAAARHGANALINVQTTRAGNSWTASADAVIAAPLKQK
jgi:flagellar biosynthesis/type III secretory pathway M-ring protein FliF/YscJ